MTEPTPNLGSRALIAAVHGYQRWISPLLPPSCRFYPSCSQYAVEALQVHGALRGSGYAALRLLKCGPWHRGGVDFVKPRNPSRRSSDGHEGPEPSDSLTNHGAS